MAAATITRVKAKASDAVYSNYDHALDTEVLKELESGQLFAQHAAWDFCGYVYKDESGWHDEIWRHGSPIETIDGESAEEAIRKANEKYGSD